MKPAEELFRCTYSMCDVFYWRDMVDFAETYASQSIIGKNTNKDSLSVNEPKELSSILTNKLDKPTVNWDEIRRIMSNYWDMDHPEANDFVNELTESLNAQLAAGEEEIAKAIEAYNSPLSIRSREEYVKWRDGLAKIITSLHPQPDAQQRFDKGMDYMINITDNHISWLPKVHEWINAMQIAAGLKEGEK